MKDFSFSAVFRRIMNVNFYVFIMLFPAVLFASETPVTIAFTITDVTLFSVLALSLPIFVMTYFLAVRKAFLWRYVASSTLTFLSLLVVHRYFSASTLPLMLSIFSVFAVIYALWFINFTDVKHVNKTEHYSLLSIVLTCFLITIFILPSSLTWGAWVVFSGVLLAIMANHFIKNISEKLRVVAAIQWLSALGFVVATLLWIKQDSPVSSVIAVSALAYFISSISHTWLAVKHLAENKALTAINETPDKPVIERDKATNLPTHHQAIHQLEQLIASSPGKEFAIITFKPMNFAQVNKVLGHHNSDILLLQLAYCLEQSLEGNEALHNFNHSFPACRIARLQGLNFVVALDLTSSDHPRRTIIEQVRKQLVTAVPAAMTFKSYSLNFDLVFGVAFSGQHGKSAAEVVSHSEDALLLGETQQVQLSYYDNKHTLYTEKQLLQMEQLKDAIQDGDIRYFIQPQVQQRQNSLVGFTLKAHWYVNNDKPLLLDQFLDIAEQSGEIFTLFRQMIDVTFDALKQLNQMKITLPVSIPLISKALLEPDISEYLEQKSKAWNVHPSRVCIDINESLLLAEPLLAHAFINQLKQIGFQVVIRHFTGSYEAIRYLRKLAIEQVKVDCSALNNHDEKNAEKVITNALLSLCNTMNLTLVGTEINTPSTLQVFSSIGGTIMQGNAIDHGVVINELEIWVKKWGYNKDVDEQQKPM